MHAKICKRATRALTTSSADPGESHHTRTPLLINATHGPCTSTNPTVDLLHQHDVGNHPSIKFLITTSTTRMILSQQGINLFLCGRSN